MIKRKRSGTPEYHTWEGIKARCHNPSSHAFRRYGARGVFVCDRWRNSYDAFFADMGQRPDGYTLDRIDSSGPYSPENCRWASMRTQQRNRGNNLHVTVYGLTLTLAEWVEILGWNYTTVHERIRRGVPPEVALTTPPQQGYALGIDRRSRSFREEWHRKGARK